MARNTPSSSQGFRVMRNQSRDPTPSDLNPPANGTVTHRPENGHPETGDTLESSGDPMVVPQFTTLSTKAALTLSDVPDMKS